MCGGRTLAAVVLALSLTAASAGTSSAAPPPFLPNPPPIAATFSIQPAYGPVGTQVTIKGACGFSSPTLLYGISVQTADGFQNIWVPTEFATLPPNPIGLFNVTFTFPANGNIPEEFGGQGNVPIVPGTYYVGATCPGLPAPMPFQPFTVTAAAPHAPPPVVPHPPPIASTFTVKPDSGPAGTNVTIQGVCGFAANTLLYAVHLSPEALDFTWLPPEWAPIAPTPIGHFSVTFTFPSTSNVGSSTGQALDPGTYYIGASCGGAVLMPFEPFTLTA